MEKIEAMSTDEILSRLDRFGMPITSERFRRDAARHESADSEGERSLPSPSWGGAGEGSATRTLWPALILYIAVAVMITWPLTAQPGTGLPDGADTLLHYWNGWWVGEALRPRAQAR